jgi:hypothetical protein
VVLGIEFWEPGMCERPYGRGILREK